MKRVRLLYLVAGLVALLAVLALACVPAVTPAPAPPATVAPTPTVAPPVQPKYGGTLLFGLEASVKSLDPVWARVAVTTRNAVQIWDPLFAHNRKLEVKPMMAESWKASDDLKTWTFTIRSGLTFHDGKPITTDDVIPSIQRWGKAVATGVAYFGLVESLTRVDDRTFQFKFKEPFGLAMDYLAFLAPFIMPKELGSQPADQRLDTTTWTGSGPLKFVSWREGDRIVLERFTGYKPRSEPFDGQAGARIVYVDRVEQREVPDPAIRVAAVEVAELDIAYYLPPDYYPRLKGKTHIQVQLTPNFEFPIVILNTANPPTNNKKLRQAILAVANAPEYLKNMYGDESLYVTCPTIFFCGTKYDNKGSAELYNQNNVEKGRRLYKEFLQETGWSGKLVLMNPREYKHIYNMLLVTLRDLEEKLQAPVEYQETDWATAVTRRNKKEGWNITGTTWPTLAGLDPIIAGWVNPFWSSFWTHPEVAVLQNRFVTAKDQAGRLAVAEAFQRLTYDDVPVVPLGNGTVVSALARHVRGFDVAWPLAYVHFWNVWLDK